MQVLPVQNWLELQGVFFVQGASVSSAAQSKRPPVAVMPLAREAVGATELRIAVLTSSAVAPG